MENSRLVQTRVADQEATPPLQAGAQWVHYELQTLIYSLRANNKALAQLGADQSKNRRELWRAFSTATLESFLVHYRNLKGFLNNQELLKSDDVLARHFSDTWTGDAYVVGEAEEAKRLNRLLAHISYSRGMLARGQWDCPQMEERICLAFTLFLKEVRTECMPLFSRCFDELNYRESKKIVGPTSNSTTIMVMWKWSDS